MSIPVCFLAETQQTQLMVVFHNARPEAIVIIVLLGIFSLSAWSTMIYKAIQMSQAKKLNTFFESEFRSQPHVLDIFDRKLEVEGCPLFSVYQQGCIELNARLKTPEGRKKTISLKAVEHIKRTVENEVARQSLKLESGLILLAIAVSGSPFLGLLGTVWGVMETFARIVIDRKADLLSMAPGVSAALLTTVAGLIVAIPSMIGYNGLVHNLRVRIVELDNFAQEMISKIETEYVPED